MSDASGLPPGLILRGARRDLIYYSYQDTKGKWRQGPSNMVLPPEGHSDRERTIKAAQAQLQAMQREIARMRQIQNKKPSVGGGVVTVGSYAEQWLKRREVDLPASWADDEHHLRLHFLPDFGDRVLGSVTSGELFDFLRALKKKDRLHQFINEKKEKVWKAVKGDKLAPRTVRNIWSSISALFRDAAVIDRFIPVSPCLGLRDTGAVPEATDKDPLRAEGLTLSVTDIEQLIWDERVPEDRRVQYALDFLSGVRSGEMAGMAWHSWDPARKPLGQLLVYRTYNVRLGEILNRTKTDAKRYVPVHPTLAVVLAHWKETGWKEFYGRAPTEADLVIPTINGNSRAPQKVNEFFKYDCEKLGIRLRNHHATRHTFITVALENGAKREDIEPITHRKKSRDAFDKYDHVIRWSQWCEAVSKIPVRVKPAPARVIRLPTSV
jgi:integrase